MGAAFLVRFRFCMAAVLDRKFRTAVQAPEAGDAAVLHPDGMAVLHFNGMCGTVFRALSAADAAFLHMKILGLPEMVVDRLMDK